MHFEHEVTRLRRLAQTFDDLSRRKHAGLIPDDSGAVDDNIERHPVNPERVEIALISDPHRKRDALRSQVARHHLNGQCRLDYAKPSQASANPHAFGRMNQDNLEIA